MKPLVELRPLPCGDGVCRCERCGKTVPAPKRGRVLHSCNGVRPQGPGTELKALLKYFGIVATPGCSCNKRAAAMDENGPDWCEANIDQIDQWLAEEAKKRKLPYLSLAGKALIRMAIRRARKKGNG